MAYSGSAQEPHIILHPADRRVTGSGGCNRFTGGYSISGASISFTRAAGTMMACPVGMEHEPLLHDALLRTTSWRIQYGRLELLDASGAVLARFEARLMN